jgi:tRNA threonylcarbamoyladenosine biosynthesis protein TsaE
MNEFVFESDNEAATDRLGAALAAVLPPGTTVALRGTLGAGKTRLVQAIAAGLGVAREEVVSPTFVLCQRYDGQTSIHHLDAYRLRDEDEFRELGALELMESSGLTFIEWADRVADCLPDERIEIDIEVTGPTSRLFRIRAVGDRDRNLSQRLDRALRT